ncbi:MAG: D-2-hydroxyacid dehydrogenase [Fibrobacterota bacterium]|nr:D-2-hydroxyacid dehydrogenase [Chitinispirillaceae bacterium]
MKSLKALVYLENTVDAFSVTADQYLRLKETLPAIIFYRVTSDRDFEELLPDCDIVITWKFLEQWYAAAPLLRWIFTPAAGNDWIVRNPSHQSIIVNGTFHGVLMTESLLGMIFFFNRRFSQLIDNMNNRIFDRNVQSSAPSLYGQHVLIIGYGAIGTYAGSVLSSLGCRISGVKRLVYGNTNTKTALYTFDKLPEIIGTADHIVTILPHDSSTDNIITPDHFYRMKRSAFFYNIGRGNCYKEETLVNALDAGYIAGAGLDVFEKEPLPEHSKLWQMNNVFIMPHSSAICKTYLDFYIDELLGKLSSLSDN